MARNIAYNQAQATVVINGLLIDNLADGDCIRIINDAVGAQKTVGTNSTMISFASDESGAGSAARVACPDHALQPVARAENRVRGAAD